MKLRYLLILGILVFLNGFVFTVLFLMASREMARPVPTPTEIPSREPTMQPTFTSTPVGPTPTNTPEPTSTSTLEPIATNTLVVAPQTPTHTNTPAPPSSTPLPPTPTIPPPTVTPTTPATEPTSTPTPTPSPTAEGDWDFRYVHGSVVAQPNCGTVYLRGKIRGVGGEPVNGRTVRLRFAGNVAYKVSGEGENPGVWGFAPLAQEHYHSPFTFLLDMVESEANPVPQSDTVEIQFTDCSVAGQFTDITFEYAR
ncbi:MAG: hypothetical protein CEE40_09635 [Chloroflexi bacterium B3_Chlor]|nr:MAG: hypothetical protein CEE40_09635 [Chloroflexi bacterium B3_Chlor]